MVQLATKAKRNVIFKVPNCSIEIRSQEIKVNLTILPLGYYEMLIGMEWLEGHWYLVIFKEKYISYLV